MISAELLYGRVLLAFKREESDSGLKFKRFYKSKVLLLLCFSSQRNVRHFPRFFTENSYVVSNERSRSVVFNFDIGCK